MHPVRTSRAIRFALDEIARVHGSAAAAAGGAPEAVFTFEGALDLAAVPDADPVTVEAMRRDACKATTVVEAGYLPAWLKAHYPAEYLCGLLESGTRRFPRDLVVAEARRMQVPVLPLDLAVSSVSYRVERIAPEVVGIRLPFREIRELDEVSLTRTLSLRPYSSLGDLLDRAALGRAAVLALAAAGALDALAGVSSPGGRGALIRSLRAGTARTRARPSAFPLDLVVEEASPPSFGVVEGTIAQVSPDVTSIVDSPVASQHLLEPYRPMLDEIGVVPAGALVGDGGGREVLVAGLRVVSRRSGRARSSTGVGIDDGTGHAECAFGREAESRVRPVLLSTRLVLVHGRTRCADDEVSSEGGEGSSGETGILIEVENAWDLTRMWSDWRARRREPLREHG